MRLVARWGVAVFGLLMMVVAAGGVRAAEKGSLEALARIEATFGKAHPNTAEALEALADRHRRQGRFQQAEPLLQRALAIREKVHGKNHPSVAALRTVLARVLLRQGKGGQALPLLERVLRDLLDYLGRDHPRTANAQLDLARLYAALPDRQKLAAALLAEAIPVLEKNLWPDHPRVAEARMVAATIHFRRGRFERAEKEWQKALAIREKAFGDEHPLVAETLGALGRYHVSRGRFETGDGLLTRSLAILEKSLGPDDPRLAAALERLAASHIRQGRHDRALPLLQRHLAIREKTLGGDHPALVKGLMDLALVHLERDRHSRAETLLRRALALAERVQGRDHLQVAYILSTLAEMYWRQGRMSAAEPLLQRSLKIAGRFFRDDPLGLANWLGSLAAIYHRSGSVRQAELLFQRSLSVMENAYGANDRRVRELAAALKALKKSDETGRSSPEAASPVVAIGAGTVDRSPPAAADPGPTAAGVSEVPPEKKAAKKPVPVLRRLVPIADEETAMVADGPATVALAPTVAAGGRVDEPDGRLAGETPADNRARAVADALELLPGSVRVTLTDDAEPVESGGSAPATAPAVVNGEKKVEGRSRLPIKGDKGIKKGYVVHLSCHNLGDKSFEARKKRVSELGLPVYLKAISNQGRLLTCVFSGPYADRSRANEAAGRIRERIGLKEILVRKYWRK